MNRLPITCPDVTIAQPHLQSFFGAGLGVFRRVVACCAPTKYVSNKKEAHREPLYNDVNCGTVSPRSIPYLDHRFANRRRFRLDSRNRQPLRREDHKQNPDNVGDQQVDKLHPDRRP
jgi:hypothetical protein